MPNNTKAERVLRALDDLQEAAEPIKQHQRSLDSIREQVAAIDTKLTTIKAQLDTLDATVTTETVDAIKPAVQAIADDLNAPDLPVA